jgi:hypothetical protein
MKRIIVALALLVSFQGYSQYKTLLVKDSSSYYTSKYKHKTDSSSLRTLISARQSDLSIVSVLDYGAVGDGTTDCTTAFSNAIASGKDVFVPKGTYKITSALTLSDNQTLLGSGYNSIIRSYVTTRAVNVGNRSVIKDLQFQGNGKTSGNAFETGIFCYLKVGWLIENCYINAFGGNDGNNGGGGIDVVSLNGTGPSDGGRISNCYVTGNKTGLNFEDRGEYVSVENTTITNNTVGAHCKAGNLSFANCIIYNNTTGLKLTTGANDGHSSFVGCRINHNTTNLDANGITQGNSFVGCHFYSGNIVFTSNKGLRFLNCDFFSSSSGANSITLTTNTSIQFAHCRYPKNPTANYMAVSLVSGNAITEVDNLDF